MNKIWLYINLVMVLVVCSSFFQKGKKTNIVFISDKCINLEASKLLNTIKRGGCLDEGGNKTFGYFYENEDVLFSKLGYKGNEKPHNWYTKALHQALEINSNASYGIVAKVAISNPNISLIGYKNKRFVFIGKIAGSNTYNLWGWDFSKSPKKTDAKPKEHAFIDLLAGQEAQKNYIEFLKQEDNYNNSTVKKVVDKWLQTGEREVVKAILGDGCIKDELAKDLDEADDAFLNQAFGKNRKPKCITDNLKASSPKPFHILTGTAKSSEKEYKIYSPKVKDTRGYMIDDYFKTVSSSDKNRVEKAWLTIVLNLNAEVLYDYSCSLDNSKKTQIFIYKDKVLCIRIGSEGRYTAKELSDGFKDNDNSLKFYSPLEAIDEKSKTAVVSFFKEKTNLASESSIRRVLDNWLCGDSTSKIRYSSMGLDTLLTIDVDEDNYNVDCNKTHHRRIGSSTQKIDWYTPEICELQNDKLSKIALLDPKAKLLEPLTSKSNGKSYVVLARKTPNYKIEIHEVEGNTYKRVIDVFEKFYSNDAAIKLAHAIYRDSSLYEHGVIQDFVKAVKNSSTPLKYIYQFDVEGSISGISPKNLLNGSTGIELPTHLNTVETTLNDKNNLKLFYRKGADSFAWKTHNGSENSCIAYTDDIHNFQNPWIAWLFMRGGNEVKVIAKDKSTQKICFIASNLGDNLWSWHFDDSLKYPADNGEKLLIQGIDELEIYTNTESKYIAHLKSDKITENETNFLLYYADKGKNKDFNFVDFHEGRKIALYTKDDNPNKFFRLGENFNKESPSIGYQVLERGSQSDFDVLQQRLKDGYRKAFYENAVEQAATITDNNVWFGVKRIGIQRMQEVGVFNISSRFGFASYETIRSKFFSPINGYRRTYNREKDLQIKENKAEFSIAYFLESCCLSDYRTNGWRSNPIGYFDRIK